MIYKLLPDFLKRLFYPEIYFEPYEFDVLGTFLKEPCKGSLNVGSHCKGCKYEKEHT